MNEWMYKLMNEWMNVKFWTPLSSFPEARSWAGLPQQSIPNSLSSYLSFQTKGFNVGCHEWPATPGSESLCDNL